MVRKSNKLTLLFKLFGMNTGLFDLRSDFLILNGATPQIYNRQIAGWRAATSQAIGDDQVGAM